MFATLMDFIRMQTVQTSHIHENVFAIRTRMSNMYIVIVGEERIAIDAGADLKQVKRGLSELGIAPESIKLLFLTHADSDHTAGIRLFKEAQVYLSIDEEPFLTGEKSRRYIKKLPVEPYYTNDGSILYFGDIQVKSIATPGHTPGSMSYLVNDRFLFTGDALGLKNGKAIPFSPKFFNMDTDQAKASLKKIANLSEISLLCTGHHGVTHDFDEAVAAWRQ